VRIAQHVHLIGSGALGAGYSHPNDCNVYAVRCGPEYLLVDSGVGQDTENLLRELQADGIDPALVTTLLLTHGHLDHSGGARWFRDHLGLKVWASDATARAVETGDETAISLTAAKRAGGYPGDFTLPPCPVDRVLYDHDLWEFEGGRLEVLSTPGHSHDLLSFMIYHPGRVSLFSGDTVFHGGRILLSDVYDCDIPAYARTLRRLAALDVDALFPGHMMWTVREAHSHLRKAAEPLERLLLPPNLI
jgi:hydroxyacylglutathione hydrolase